MNIIGLGTDIVNINRIKKIYSKYGNHFLDKILTEAEKKIEGKITRSNEYCNYSKEICC